MCSKNKQIDQLVGYSIFISELELFNLRNDKDNNFDLILNILIIGEIIKLKKFNDIKVITDNSLVK